MRIADYWAEALPFAEAVDLLRRPEGEPGFHALDRRFDLVGRDGEAEADETIATDRIEVEPWSHRHARIAQQGFAERQAVVGQVADIGIDIKSAIRRRDPAKPHCRERPKQKLAIARIGANMRQSNATKPAC